MGQRNENDDECFTGNTWAESRMLVESELRRQARNDDRLEKALNSVLVSIAILETKAAILGFVGGIIGTGLVALLVKVAH